VVDGRLAFACERAVVGRSVMQPSRVCMQEACGGGQWVGDAAVSHLHARGWRWWWWVVDGGMAGGLGWW
jgi:hypothetical protein